jgi:hypothetical protein
MECKFKKNFLSKVKISNTGCWEWQYTTNNKGYGQYRENGKRYFCHRYVYEKLKEKITNGLWVLHKCDNPKCCNPDHLFLGTHADNMRDMVNKGRALTGSRNPSVKYPEKLAYGRRNGNYTHPECRPHGETHGQAKLKEIDVINIKRLIEDGYRISDITKKYKVSHQTISAIKTSRKWAYLKAEGL